MRLEEYRKFKGLTYDELAKALNLNKTTVYRICKKNLNCRLSEALKILDRTSGYVRITDLLN